MNSLFYQEKGKGNIKMKKLEQLLKNASPRPWSFEGKQDITIRGEDKFWLASMDSIDLKALKSNKENTQLITLAVNNFEEAILLIKQLMSALDYHADNTTHYDNETFDKARDFLIEIGAWYEPESPI